MADGMGIHAQLAVPDLDDWCFRLMRSHERGSRQRHESRTVRDPDVHRLMLVLRLHHRDRPRRNHKPRSRFRALLPFRTAHGTGTPSLPQTIPFHLVLLTIIPDILRRPRQTRHPRPHVPPLHRPIPHGPLHHRRRQPPDLGLQPRRRPPLLQLLPPHLPALRLHSPPCDLGLRPARRRAGPAVLDRARGRAGSVQSRGRRQQPRLGRSDLRARGVGAEEIQARAVLYGG